MLSIQLVDSGSPHFINLYQMLNNEWDDLEVFAETKHGKAIPNPILALEDEQLIGGLVFTRFLSPITQIQAVWINAVFIKPEHRHKGISSQLINYAEQLIKQTEETELFVYTDIPQLYLKLNWQIIEIDKEHYVLKSSLV